MIDACLGTAVISPYDANAPRPIYVYVHDYDIDL